MRKIYCLLFCLLFLIQFVPAQFSLREISPLGKLQARHLKYYPDTKQWILSDGYSAFSTNADFSNTKLLFNTYPKYQFELERFPNKNFYSRHFDTEFPPFGFEVRSKKLDSSAFYIMDDNLKSTDAVRPSSYFRIREQSDGKQLMIFGTNTCQLWGNDSSVFCNNGVIGIIKDNDRANMVTINTKNRITSLETAVDAMYSAAGTNDSGWYFIPSADPGKFLRIPAIEEKIKITHFYFNAAKKQVWVQEEKSWLGFHAMAQYDYSSGIPEFIKRVTAAELGLGTNTDALFAFDFQLNKLYVKSVIKQLLLFNLDTRSIEKELSGPVSDLSVIHQLYFNPSDNFLYLAGEKFDRENTGSNNFLFRVEKDTLVYANITPKNQTDYGNIYATGLRTAVNKLPANSYKVNNDNVTLAENNLALIPYSDDEMLLYDIRSGNMIQSFRAGNIIDLDVKSRFYETNKVLLSPNGKILFEWMIKAGISSGIADTLQVAMTDIKSGVIRRNKIVLSQKESKNIRHFNWDHMGRPVFAQTASGNYPAEKVSSFYLDSLLQPQLIVEYLLQDPGVLYSAWNIAGTKNMLVETGNLGANKMYKYQLLNSIPEDSSTVLVSTESAHLLQNNTGFLLKTAKDDNILLAWYNNNGKLIHNTTLATGDYRVQHLAEYSAQLFLTEIKTGNACKLDLATGNITALHGKSKPGYHYRVSPDEKLMVSVSDQIQTWMVQKDSLYKLYSLQAQKDFIKYTQLTGKHLVSDGRVWNLQTGLLLQADLAATAVLNDTQYVQAVYPYEILNDLGYDENYKRTYELKSYKKSFIKNLPGPRGLSGWKDNFNSLLLASKSFSGNSLENIYELPLSKASASELQLFPIPSQQSLLVVKSPFQAFDEGPMKNPADTILLLDLETGNVQPKLSGKIVGFTGEDNAGACLFYLLNQQTGGLQLYRTAKGRIDKVDNKIKLTIDSFRHINIVDEHSIVYKDYNRLVFYNLATGHKEFINYNYLSGNSPGGSFLHYDTGEKVLYELYEDGSVLKIENKKVVEAVKAMSSGENIIGVQGKFLVTMDKLGNYCFIDKKTLEPSLTLFTWKGNSFSDRKYMWLTKENYYMATPGVESNIHFVNKSNVIPLRQGDLEYNRPDKVMEYLGAPKTEIDFYNQLYQLRVNKYKASKNITNTGEQNGIDLKVATRLEGKNTLFTLDAKAPGNIAKLQVMINGCPVTFQPNQQSARQIHQTIPIALNAGTNIVYTWVEDEKGNRSAFDEQKIEYEIADSGKWYFVGIGVSRYKDTAQNLLYADKDIRDLAKFLSGEYPGISIDTLLNEEVTSANIEQIAAKLKKTNPDDKVMVSFSGHGLLDKDKKFWYATHDLNFAQPAQAGFSMSSISAMLENIPARYRMITLDACHSGDFIQSGNAAATKPEIKEQPAPPEQGIKGNILLSVKRGDKSSSQLLKSMQLVFTDQLSNTGINLIAASSGTEFALEGKEWKNGVFTSALIRGWGYGARENSSYSAVHYRGLKQYLQQTVSNITNGRQTPNTVMENGEINWWLIPGK